MEEGGNIGLGEAGRERRRRHAAADLPRPRQGLVEARGILRDIVRIECAVVGEMHQEPGEQRGVGARLQSEKQLGVFCAVGAARIDHDHARAALLPVREHALEQHGMAPGRVGADQHEQVGLVEVLVTAGHGIGAEGAAMAGDGGRHAEP
jgi:hypothetical protein